MSRVTIGLLIVILVSSAVLAQPDPGFMGAYQPQTQIGVVANANDIANERKTTKVYTMLNSRNCYVTLCLGT